MVWCGVVCGWMGVCVCGVVGGCVGVCVSSLVLLRHSLGHEQFFEWWIPRPVEEPNEFISCLSFQV